MLLEKVSSAALPYRGLEAVADSAPPAQGAHLEPVDLFVTPEATEAPAAPSFQRAFTQHLGGAALEQLRAQLSDQPVVLIGGRQLTGKTTTAKQVAEVLGGEVSGSGRVMRAHAEQAGISLAEMLDRAAVDPQVDVEIDFRAASLVGRGLVSVFESRLAGQLGRFLREQGRANLLSIYLDCAPKERVLRHVAREHSEADRDRLEPLLQVAPDADFETCLRALAQLEDPVAKQVAARFEDVAHRDDADAVRLRTLYGVDFQDPTAYDVVIDTTGKSSEAVSAEVLAAVERVRRTA